MPRIVSDTQELCQIGETVPPTSGPVPNATRNVDRLLATLTRLHTVSSLSDVVAALLRDFGEVLPGYAFAVRIPADDGTPELLLSVPPIENTPEHAWANDVALFENYAHERRVPLTCRPEPACLHCAADDPALDSDTSSVVRTVVSCASVLTTAIRFVDAQQALARREQELEELKSMLVQTDKLSSLGEISAGLVHELTNPLTSIVAYTDYLRKKSERRGDDPEDIERLRRVGEAADLILSFTRAIVSYAKPDDDIPCPVDVVQVVDQALLFCKHVVDDSHVTVRRDIDSALPLVRSVRGQLTQVMVNLITNACQAMVPDGGTLTITAEVDGANRAVLLRVDDTGPGIEPGYLDRVFDPFFTTKEDGGTGLGLNIVRQIVRRTGGSISVESTEGKGASFIVSLPMHTAHE